MSSCTPSSLSNKILLELDTFFQYCYFSFIANTNRSFETIIAEDYISSLLHHYNFQHAFYQNMMFTSLIICSIEPKVPDVTAEVNFRPLSVPECSLPLLLKDYNFFYHSLHFLPGRFFRIKRPSLPPSLAATQQGHYVSLKTIIENYSS